jgi:putative glutamine amidotransferase
MKPAKTSAKRPPIVLVSPNIEKKGEEFGDMSTSLSETYQKALMNVGAIPLALPASASREVIAECVSRCDGALLTGGEDIDPRLYGNGELPANVRRTVTVTPDGGVRDLREFLLIDEIFRQKKSLLAICRGQQVLNVALGGTLIADIAAQKPDAINHRRMDKRSHVVHQVRLVEGSLLSKVTRKNSLGVNSTHHQAVDRVAPPLEVSAFSEDGIIEGLQLKPEAVHSLPFLLSVQFHPERLADRYPEHQAIFRVFTQSCVLTQKH